jgi:hypothetical protein
MPGFRYGQVDSRDEEFLRLQKRIQYLEGRLAEAQVHLPLPYLFCFCCC